MAEGQPNLQVGGTLKLDDLYIRRTEDDTVYELIAAHEFVNILTSRQMGKSSLMVRIIDRLRHEHPVKYATVEMAGLGTPTDPHEWYRGLLDKIALRLGLPHDVDEWWANKGRGTHNDRLQQFLRDVVCGSIAEPVIIFLDEIDATLRLPYSDDLFTAIRAIYNERAEDPVLKRLTFCLIGVASPRELIKERRTTPYNIGKSVELRDFDPVRDDLSPLRDHLAAGGGDGGALLTAVLRWTGGHPFLTTALTALVRKRDVTTATAVDALVEDDTFAKSDEVRGHLEHVARFIETRLENQAATFLLYERVLRGRKVPDRVTSAFLDLRLSGLVKRGPDDRLVVRNKIYQRRFGLPWLRQTRPLRAQTRLWRLVIVLGVVALAGLAWGGWSVVKMQQRRAHARARIALAEKAVIGFEAGLAAATSDDSANKAKDNLCAALKLDSPRPLPWQRFRERAEDAWEDYWTARADGLETRAQDAADADAALLLAALADVKRGQVSDGSRRITEANRRPALVATLRGHTRAANRVRFIDATHVVSIGEDSTMRLFDLERGFEAAHQQVVDAAPALAVCPDSACILTASSTMLRVQRWTFAFDPLGGSTILFQSNGDVAVPLQPRDAIYALAIDTAGARFAAGGKNGDLVVMPIASLSPNTPVAPPRERRVLAHVGDDGKRKLVYAAQFVTEGDRLFTAALDGVRHFDLSNGESSRVPLYREAVLDLWVKQSSDLIALALEGEAAVIERFERPRADWGPVTFGWRRGYQLARGSRVNSIDVPPDLQSVLGTVVQLEGDREVHRVVVWPLAGALDKPIFDQETPPARDARFGPGTAPSLIASAHADGAIRIWSLVPEATVDDVAERWRLAQRQSGRTLTADGQVVDLTNGDRPRPAIGYTPELCPPPAAR